MNANQTMSYKAIEELLKIEAAVENIFQAIDDADELFQHFGYFAGFHIPVNKNHPLREGAAALRREVYFNIGRLTMELLEGEDCEPSAVLRAFDGTTVEEERARYRKELNEFLDGRNA